MSAYDVGDVTTLTIPQLLAKRAAQTPNAVALRHKEYGIWNETTYAGYLARAREVAFELSPPWAQHGFHLKEGKEAVHGYVVGLIERGAVHDRVSLVDALTEAGLEVTRAGKDYVTVRDPDTDERLRLRGRIYEKDWNDDAELGRAAAREVGEPDGRDRGLDRERAAEALAACEREREHRAD